MLRASQLYKEEIREKYVSIWYDDKYKYYVDRMGFTEPSIPDNNINNHSFVSVNAVDEVLGVIDYTLDWVVGSAWQLGIISFGKSSMIFVKDVLQVIDNMFNKYHLNRMSFFAVEDNPAIKSYRRLMKLIGGKECGRYRQSVKLLDDKLHNEIMFEILADEYKGMPWRFINGKRDRGRV